MAGGTFKTKNKTLPGAYFRFEAVKKPKGVIGARGIATMPIALSWGVQGEVIELLSTDLVDGKSLAKVGFSADDFEKSKLARLCLENCYKLLIYRIDKGGKKATATIGSLTISAKYAGTFGNSIKIAVIVSDTKKEVVTFVNELEKDRQAVTSVSELKSNDFVNFTGEGALSPNAGTALTGGTDGTVATANYTDYFNELKTKEWQVMGVPSEDKKLPIMLKSYIESLRDVSGKYVQGIVYDYSTADSMGIISVKQGFKRELEEVSPVEFVAYITGASAGADVNESNCFKVITGATAIVSEFTEDEIEEEQEKGSLMLIKRVDQKIVICDDVNTLRSYTDEIDEDFSDNFVVRLFDEIATTTRLIFEKSKVGKTANTLSGRETLKAQLIANFEALQNMTGDPAIQNFDVNDIKVEQGDGMGDVVVTAYIQPAGKMKKLYATLYKGKAV